MYVAGLREDIVVSVEQVMQLLSTGEANRHIGATKMNEGSSRSHTVFRMVSVCELRSRPAGHMQVFNVWCAATTGDLLILGGCVSAAGGSEQQGCIW